MRAKRSWRPGRSLLWLPLGAVLALSLCAPWARADDQPLAVRPAPARGKVSAIHVAGLHRLEEAAIRAAITTRVGEDLADWKVQRDIRSIWATGFVDDVQADLSPAPNGQGVVLTYIVDERPAVRDVTITGNKKIDAEQLKEALDIQPFDVLNRAQVKRNARAIREKYVEKGYYLVEVDPQVKQVGDDLVELTFVVTENHKVVVQSIDITGNQALPDRKFKRYMRTKQGGILPWLTNTGNFDQQKLQDDVQIVRTVLLENGYLDGTVDPPQTYLSPDRRFIYITIHVTEGVKYKLGAITVSGDFVPEQGLTREAVRQILVNGVSAREMRKRWENALAKAKARGRDLPEEGWEEKPTGAFDFDPDSHDPLTTGETFQYSTMGRAVQEVSAYYGDQGYAFANVVPVPDTRPDAGLVDINFDIQKGQKVRIGRIDITGNTTTYDKVVRREIPLNEGDTYEQSKIQEARQRLNRLGFFETVQITTPRGIQPDVLDMKVDVTEKPTGTFSVGAGFSNLENFIFTANVSKNNFLGLGYVMSFGANVSKLRQQWNLQLYDPYFLDSRWTLRVQGYSLAQQFVEDEFQRGGSVAVGRYLDPQDDLRLEFGYTLENTGLTSLDAYKQKLLGGELYRNGVTSSGNLNLILDKRNNRIQPTRGVYGTISLGLTGGFRINDEEIWPGFGGDFNFVESKLNFRYYRPVVPHEDWLIFRFNSSLGRIWSTDGTVVPYIHRYRAGGINSVRGYNWYSLGPAIRANGYASTGQRSSTTLFTGSDDPTAADDRLVVGGTETWVNNFELQIPVIQQAGISTVFFFDAGNTFGDPWGNGHIDPFGLRTAYGLGIRWLSPMGPLRFEEGFPINPRPDERKAVFDFSIGSLF